MIVISVSHQPILQSTQLPSYLDSTPSPSPWRYTHGSSIGYAMETGGVLMLLLSQPLTALAEDVATRL